MSVGALPIVDPQQLARVRALQALFGQQAAQQPQVSDENPTAPPPSPVPIAPKPAGKPAPGLNQGAAPNPPQAQTTAQGQPQGAKPVNLATPGAISSAVGTARPAAAPAMTFDQFNQAHPGPAPEPQRDLKSRLLHTLYAGGIGALGGADAGTDYYRRWANPNQTAYDKAQAADAAQHAGYQRYLQGQEGPSKLDQLHEQIAASQAEAKERNAQAGQYDMVPVKLPDGTEIQVMKKDAERFQQAVNAPKLKNVIVDDPANPGMPKYAQEKPDGTIVDPDTGKPIAGAKPFEKPGAEKPVAGTVNGKRAWGVWNPQKGWVGTDGKSLPNFEPPAEQPNFASIYPQIRGAEAMEKPTTEYSNFNAGLSATKANMADAQNGDQLANAIAPLQSALMIVGANGVHRINMTEINRAGDPAMGSIARRVDAALEHAKTGKLPADTIKEMQRLVDMYGQWKYKAYLQQARSTAAYFKLDDPPVMTQDGNGFVPLSEALSGAKMGGVKGGRGESETVKMRAPNGQEQTVSADQVEHYKKLGAKIVQ